MDDSRRRKTPPPSPSPDTPGEGSGEGLQNEQQHSKSDARATNPHPNPLPGYRARGKSCTGTHWTPEQLRGIQTVGHSLLVSAAAGSGKTAMLAARCAQLVCDERDDCGIDELLVVTFTEAAAAEMKARIHSALRDRAAESNSARLHRQVALADRASVSTLHAFCARLLREHFHAVGLDPAFTVLDGDEASLLRREIARQLFDDRYEEDATGEFQRFIDAYGEGDDSRLIRRVIQTFELLRSLVDPQAWIDRSRQRIAEGIEGRLEDSQLGRELVRHIARQIADTRTRCARNIQLVQSLGKFAPYLEALSGFEKTLRHYEQTVEGEGLDALAEVAQTIDFPRLPAVSNSVPNKEPAKAAVDAIKEALTKSGWRDLLRFKAAEWQQGLRAILPHAEVFLKLVEDFGSRYGRAKDAARVVDFSDLEQLALQVLSDGPPSGRKPSAQARAYHQRFKHVLVDEYQDINEVQDAILALLSRECVHGEPAEIGNLFCVGDVKQSIYRFRLAEPARFLDRQKLFRAPASPRRGEVIDLQANFRSRAPLLEAVNAVFERLMTESAVDITYDQSHHLRPGLQYPAADGQTCFIGSPIEMHLLPDELAGGEEDAVESADEDELDRSEREAVLVARRIRQLTGMDGSPPYCVTEKDASGGLRPRPIRFGDIVVLLRSIRYKSEQYADVLRRAGVPVHSQSGTGYFDSTEIRDMLALLSLLDNQRQDIPLATVLRSALGDLPQPEDAFARVRLAYPASGEAAVPFHDAVVAYAREKNDALAEQLSGFLFRLNRWRQLAHSRPLAEVISTIFDETGYLAYCAGLHDGEQRVANLMDLHDRAGHFGTFQRQGLSRFMHFLESLREETDLGQPSIASEADNVVRVMSVHRSKGLEFPVVFLPDLGKRINFTDCQGAILADRSAGLGMAVVDDERMIRYPSLSSVIVQQRLRQQSLAEELRVLYVAMTRAREHLILVGTCKPDKPKDWATKWAAQTGAFPNDMVLGAKCLLDWLGPTAVVASTDAGEAVIEITQHSAEEVASWQAAHSKRPVLSAAQARLAALEPIDPAPAITPEAGETIARLEFEYPYEGFAQHAAVEAVTARSKQPGPSIGSQKVATRELPTPRFLLDSHRASTPAEIGTATHRVLAHLDFARRCDRADVEAQIASMLERRLLSAGEASVIDLATIEWLMGTDLGALLRANATNIRREIPIHFAVEPAELSPSGNPEDRVMVRGRIDALLPLSEGITLIDYKTDNLSAANVPHRARDYAGQMRLYADALSRIADAPVKKSYLVFLTPRVVWSL